MLMGGFALGFLVRPQFDSGASAPAVGTSAISSAPRADTSIKAPATVSASASPGSAATQEAFESIYKNAAWARNDAGLGTSGTGSTLEATYVYRAYLAKFMKDNDIHSVVDAGCGDWEFSRTIDWTGVDYKGFDITRAVVERNKKIYAKPGIEFFHGDIVEVDLPAADLLVSKHVLQHLPNAAVAKFLEKQVPKYKHVLLTNGIDKNHFTGNNGDIKPGDYRTLDVTAPPFNATGTKVVSWYDGLDMHQIVHIVPKK